MPRLAKVLLPLPLPEAFDYLAPDDLADLAVGDHVAAPLGPRVVRGVVVEMRDAAGVNRPLKTLQGRLEAPPLPATALAFASWAARYACQPAGEALAMSLRGLNQPLPRPERSVVIGEVQPAKRTLARARVLEVARETSLPPAELARRAGVSAGVVKALLDEGALRI